MKLDISKLNKEPEKKTNLDLSQIKTSEAKEEPKKNMSLSFSKIDNADQSEVKKDEVTKFRHLALPKSTDKKPEESNKGFSLIFTDKKTYNLDTIIYDKRRDNANCPLILKVTTDRDKEIVKLVTILILDDYLNAGKPEEEQYSYEYLEANYETLVEQVPDFYHVFDSYFNKYYGYYYKKIQERNFIEGAISLDTIKETIVEAYNNDYDNLLGDALDEYSGAVNTANKPKIEYELGTEQGPDDITPDTSYLSLKIKDNKLFIANSNVILPGQAGVPFSTINGQIVLNSTTNFELLTFDDYIELAQSEIILTNDENILCSNDNYKMVATIK